MSGRERRTRLWSLALIVLVALNLRPAIAAVGPLLADIRADLDLSSATAGALTTLPVLCFGAFGLLAPALRRRFREEILLVASLILLAAGLLVRTGPLPATLFCGTVMVGIAISVGNITVPAVIKRDHPAHVTSSQPSTPPPSPSARPSRPASRCPSRTRPATTGGHPSHSWPSQRCWRAWRGCHAPGAAQGAPQPWRLHR